jgi:hypothetical protein
MVKGKIILVRKREKGKYLGKEDYVKKEEFNKRRRKEREI